jgi:hypothetical protein
MVSIVTTAGVMHGSVPRVVRALLGLVLIAVCVYEIYTGTAQGKFRTYDRYREPWSYWTSIVLTLLISSLFFVDLH